MRMASASPYLIDERNLERQRLLACALQPITEHVLRQLSLKQGATCLDLGCGIGETTRLLARELPDVTRCIGLELDGALVQVASQQDNGPLVQFQQGDVLNPPFEPGTFDLVFARFLLTHLPNAEDAVKSMMRLAGAGGIIVAMEPELNLERCCPVSWAYERLPALMAVFPNQFAGRKLVHLFRRAGATNISAHAECVIEPDSAVLKRLWTLSIEAMGPALLAKGIVTEVELADLLIEFKRVELDDASVVLSSPVVCVWATV
jgi:SAM-dependent methyltransferase